MKRRTFLKLLSAVGATTAAVRSIPAIAEPFLPIASAAPEILDQDVHAGYQIAGEVVVQWGTAQAGTFVAFPLRFARVFNGMAASDCDEPCAITELSAAGMSIVGRRGATADWIAVGDRRMV